MHSLGQTIKQLREKKQLSQKDFAKQLGISNVVLSRYENDIRKPDYDTLEKIADCFHVSLDYLFGRTNVQMDSLDKAINLSDEQQKVVQFLLQLDAHSFEQKPTDLLMVLEQFEVYYNVYKDIQKKKK